MKIFYVWKTKLKYLNKLNGSIDTIYQLTTIAQRKHQIIGLDKRMSVSLELFGLKKKYFIF